VDAGYVADISAEVTRNRKRIVTLESQIKSLRVALSLAIWHIEQLRGPDEELRAHREAIEV
jgi:hypothetical protein